MNFSGTIILRILQAYNDDDDDDDDDSMNM